MYEPYEYTNHKMNQGKYRYPGNINGKEWDKEEIKSYLSSVIKFQQFNNIPSNRILVGEFGGHSMSPVLHLYFKDQISLFQNEEWHFVFCSFRY